MGMEVGLGGMGITFPSFRHRNYRFLAQHHHLL